jgi:hypothetical protein
MAFTLDTNKFSNTKAQIDSVEMSKVFTDASTYLGSGEEVRHIHSAHMEALEYENKEAGSGHRSPKIRRLHETYGLDPDETGNSTARKLLSREYTINAFLCTIEVTTSKASVACSHSYGMITLEGSITYEYSGMMYGCIKATLGIPDSKITQWSGKFPLGTQTIAKKMLGWFAPGFSMEGCINSKNLNTKCAYSGSKMWFRWNLGLTATVAFEKEYSMVQLSGFECQNYLRILPY